MFPPNNEVDVDSRKVICTHYFVVFSSAVCNGSFLIYLSFIRFNVVVVIGQDDTEVWTTSSTTRATYGHRIGIRRGFLTKRRSNGKRFHFRVKLRKRLLRLSDSDFISNYRILNVSLL